MNQIDIIAPRWRDRVVLVADWKITRDNKIVIAYKTFPNPFYLSGEKAKTYPIEEILTKNGSTARMRAIPLDDLEPMLDEL